jgi:hypothetical protein
MSSKAISGQMGSSLEQRLRVLEDHIEIATLRGEYCHLLDARDWPAFVALFTEDGYFRGLAEARGQAELLEFFSKRVPAMIEDFWHFCSNGTVYLDGDTATGRISLDYLSVVDGVSHVSAGHYDDVFQRMDRRWRFKSRIITFYFLAPLSEGWAGKSFPELTSGGHQP